MKKNEIGVLVLVGTPIGNLGDLAPRAVKELEEADSIFAEDTRRTLKLTGTRHRMQSYNDHNAGERLLLLEKLLRDGQTVALVTDAGMPGISDPAFRAVKRALDMGAGIRVVPGPSAVTAALVASGLAVDRFSFEGFLPRKKGNRRRRLEEIAEYRGTLVFFVGPHHLSRYLAEMLEVLGNRPACVARELTKVHEEFVRGTLEGLELQYRNSEVRGEITLLVGRAKPD